MELCVDCHLETRPELPPPVRDRLPPQPTADELRNQWSEAIASGKTPIVITVETRSDHVSLLSDAKRRLREDPEAT